MWLDILLSLVLLGVVGLGIRDKNCVVVAVGLVCGYIEMSAVAYVWSDGSTRLPGFYNLLILWRFSPLLLLTALPAAVWGVSRWRRGKDQRRESDEVLMLVAIIAAFGWLISLVST